MLEDLFPSGDRFAVKRLEEDRRFAQHLLSGGYVVECFGQENEFRLFADGQVTAKAVLLVLLSQPLQITKFRKNANEHLLEAGLPRRTPTLLTANDLVVAGPYG